jgi:hypothetical protein
LSASPDIIPTSFELVRIADGCFAAWDVRVGDISERNPRYLREIAEFCRRVVTQVAAYITGGVIAAVVFLYERYSQQNISLDALNWGLLVFILVACFLTWKNERDKNREPDTTRVQLDQLAVGRFVVLLGC